MNQRNTELANELRALIQQRTEQIDDGEAVAAILLWSFIEDHAHAHGLPVATLAREQWAAFTDYAQKNLSVARAPGVPAAPVPKPPKCPRCLGEKVIDQTGYGEYRPCPECNPESPYYEPPPARGVEGRKP